MAHQITNALSTLEDRIEVVSVEVNSEGDAIYANITFRVLMYDTTYGKKVKVGDSDGKITN